MEIVSKFGSNKKKRKEGTFGCTKSKLNNLWIASQITCAATCLTKWTVFRALISTKLNDPELIDKGPILNS